MARPQLFYSWAGAWVVLTTFFSFCTHTLADTRWIQYTGNEGTVWLDNARKPSIYAGDFGDCQGDSLINVTRFDAAYYKDNMTVLFHLEGNSALTNQSLMLYIGVYAYGEARFNLTFDPCKANIKSLCPLNSSLPIQANGIIPVSQQDVANIPPLALVIPDFEAQAILRVFANETESQIACFSARLTNGATFSHPAAVGSILGVFTFIALVSSVATAVYGQVVPETRKHYAHSVSVFVVFSVFQHIFFTGGLSMNWPSVLVAFWSNYAWSAGMIYTESMQNSINKFIGSNGGNISMVGSAPSGQNAVGLGGGYQLSSIYKRAVGHTSQSSANIAHSFTKRATAVDGFTWYGEPVRPGLPLPGNFSGFAGTLAPQQIPASNAFMTGFLWFLILIVLIAVSVIALKWTIEGLAAVRVVKTQRLAYFRQHWLAFTATAVLRTCYVAFFMMMFLTMFQFTLGGSTGVKAIAAIVFVLFLVGMLGVVGYALYYRLKHERFVRRGAQTTPNNKPSASTKHEEDSIKQSHAASLPPWCPRFTDTDSGRPHVHDDEDYTVKFGWLSSRFRRSKWWFFAFWVVYEFVRACFYGGAAGHALVQVFGLLAWEIIAFMAVIWLKPFESNRLNLLMVYLLGFSKVATVALSSAFDARFQLGRILTTVIGIIIIIIQGVLTICLMIAIVLGAISSYMSITRDQETMKPKSWLRYRERYFAHIDQKATDLPKPPPPPPPPMPEKPKEPYFSVTTIRREPKIEDEEPGSDDDYIEGRMSVEPSRDPYDRSVSRAQSVRSRTSRTSASNLPYGARQHRSSWSTRDLTNMTGDLEQVPSGYNSRVSYEAARDGSNRNRSASVRAASRTRVDSPVGSKSVTPKVSDSQLGKTQTKRSSMVQSENKRPTKRFDEEDAITPSP